LFSLLFGLLLADLLPLLLLEQQTKDKAAKQIAAIDKTFLRFFITSSCIFQVFKNITKLSKL